MSKTPQYNNKCHKKKTTKSEKRKKGKNEKNIKWNNNVLKGMRNEEL